MSKYSVRVEMHYASEAQYERLHATMYAAGYVRFVFGGDGNAYQLPTAMYEKDFGRAVTAEAVRDQVRGIAHAIDSDADIYVARYDDQAWFLHKVKKAA